MSQNPNSFPTHVEMIDAIMPVSDLALAIQFYTEKLGFTAADWSTDDFTQVGLGGYGLYLSLHQGTPGEGWIWIGVGDVRALHELYESRGVRIAMAPTNTPWALELRVRDQDGNTIRFGSDPDV
ncbi:MAG: VOC family protein [Pseudomonadota bacterium]